MFECVVFISGALVMVLEMVGARVMAPYLGTSVIVWTSLIGVVLACLAGGAYIGGQLADKRLSRATLAGILAGAGVGSGVTALVHPLVGTLVTASIPDPRAAAVLAALCLFALPATLFGMISPYVIRLRLAALENSGATVGKLYALSTAGSIIGTFLGGFVLVSYFASTDILLGTAIAMLVLSLAVCRTKAAPRIAAGIFFALVISGAQSYNQWLAAQGSPRPIETPYNCIRIMQGFEGTRPVRAMATDPGYMQSGMYLDQPEELLFAYTRYYALPTALFSKAHNVLMLGGGGYSVPKWLLAGRGGLDSDALRLTVVEIDPGMTETARTQFALKDDPRMCIVHEDARRFLNANNKQYDLVFVDVFNSHYSIPFHMGTVEAMRALRHAVKDDGAVMMNSISAVDGESARLFRALYAALRQQFAEVHVFAVHKEMPRTSVQNLMLLALPTPRPDLAATLREGKGRWSERVQDILQSRLDIDPATDATPPLRDDFAPVERYAQALLKN